MGDRMLDQYDDAIRAEALAAYPNEAVWLITSAGCRRVANIAEDPTSTFKVANQDMAYAMSETLLAVVHSHPDYPDCPSAADMRGQLSSAVPWAIVATDGQATKPLRWFGVANTDPLVGRGFVHGIQDCYALIKDYYAQELGIQLPEYPRDWEWWLNGEDLYSQGFETAGFVEINAAQAKPNDMWLAQLRGKVASHGGLLLENGLALHHPSGRHPVDESRISLREPITRWMPYITRWFTHKESGGLSD